MDSLLKEIISKVGGEIIVNGDNWVFYRQKGTLMFATTVGEGTRGLGPYVVKCNTDRSCELRPDVYISRCSSSDGSYRVEVPTGVLASVFNIQEELIEDFKGLKMEWITVIHPMLLDEYHASKKDHMSSLPAKMDMIVDILKTWGCPIGHDDFDGMPELVPVEEE